MQWIIPIAVKPYIKKYVERSLIDSGYPDPVNPFVLATTHKFGMFLYHCLEKPALKAVKQLEEEELDALVYSDKLRVSVSEHFWNKKGCIITPQKQLHFNKFVAYDFNDEFFKYVRMRIGKKGSINQAIFNFREYYSITEDELSFKTIQRSFQRRNAPVTTSKSA